MSKKWYVLHTYTAQEDRVRETIIKGIKDTDFEHLVGEILIPRQKTYIIKDGKKIERERKIYQSYIIIECELTKTLLTYIVGIPGVTHFLGSGKTPQDLSPEEVDRLLGIEERSGIKVNACDYYPGDKVKIISGPFADFDGLIDKIATESEKLIVNVTVFGRETPVEVNMDQVELM
jgi:transcriptional antiterminator NusG